ncbi:MAG: hypothetical protein E6J26_06980, partial [Chloroflexi bacterium]
MRSLYSCAPASGCPSAKRVKRNGV